MSTKYHFSPVTGKKSVCNATTRACRYGEAAHTTESDKTEAVNEFFNVSETKKTAPVSGPLKNVPVKTQKFVELLNEKFKSHGNPEHPYTQLQFSIVPGRVYDKIVTMNGTGSSRSVYAFTTKNEERFEVIKAAGWKTPQKNADGSLAIRHTATNEAGVKSIVEQADPYGSFLYVR